MGNGVSIQTRSLKLPRACHAAFRVQILPGKPISPACCLRSLLLPHRAPTTPLTPPDLKLASHQGHLSQVTVAPALGAMLGAQTWSDQGQMGSGWGGPEAPRTPLAGGMWGRRVLRRPLGCWFGQPPPCPAGELAVGFVFGTFGFLMGLCWNLIPENGQASVGFFP